MINTETNTRKPRRMARDAPASTDADATTTVSVNAEPRLTKAALLIGLLRREQGATLVELVAATGWQPHTTRAALTGLRKKGHVLDKSKRDEAACYRIAGEP